MNLRCLYCQTPFTLSRIEMLNAIVTMNEKHMSHYDAHCPRCRRANSISRQRMELFFPNWREAAKQMESAPASPPVLAPASAAVKTEPLPKAVKEAVLKAAAAQSGAAATAKPAAPKRQRAGKTSDTKKTAAKPKRKTPAKPAAKSTTKPAKPAAKSRKK
jgi:hypothetical protein